MKDQSTPPSHGLLLIYDVITANNKIASALLTPSSVGTRMYLGSRARPLKILLKYISMADREELARRLSLAVFARYKSQFLRLRNRNFCD